MRLPALGLLLLTCAAAGTAAEPTPVPLWPGDAPGAHGKGPDDIPTLTTYPIDPAVATGAAMVILPGGGYGGLADPHEGGNFARFLAEHGVAGFVLHYRLGSHGYHHPVELEDAARALRTVRAHAAEWKVDPKRIGIMGSSAGGHLASTLLTHFDAGDAKSADPIEQQSSRPDLGVLCYAVITMGPDTHGGSKANLLGSDPAPELVTLLSNEQQVTKDTPPCFLWSTWEDKTVKVENTLAFAAALRRAGVPMDLHVYERGGHGLGLANGHPWTKDLIFWLTQRGWAK